MDVGFVGLGVQGLPMAQRIRAAGWNLSVWARRPDSVAPLVGTGTTVRSSLRELGAHADLVGVCVGDDDDVRDVIAGAGGLRDSMRPGSIVAIHSTVMPETCTEMADVLAEAGVEVVDAPVSGGATGAEDGTLVVMVGGSTDAFEKSRPVFESYGSPAHLGPLGSGQVMKLLNNAAFMANLRIVFEVLELADSLSLDRAAAEEVLLHSSGGSSSLRSLRRFRLLPDLGHVRMMLGKDLGHFANVAGRTHVDPTTHRLGLELLELLAAMDGQG